MIMDDRISSSTGNLPNCTECVVGKGNNVLLQLQTLPMYDLSLFFASNMISKRFCIKNMNFFNFINFISRGLHHNSTRCTHWIRRDACERRGYEIGRETSHHRSVVPAIVQRITLSKRSQAPAAAAAVVDLYSSRENRRKVNK